MTFIEAAAMSMQYKQIQDVTSRILTLTDNAIISNVDVNANASLSFYLASQ